MELFDVRLGHLVCGVINDIVNAAKMIDRLQNVVDARVLGCRPQRIRLENEPRLFLGQPAPFDMVRIVGQVNLRAMINAPLEAPLLFLTQTLQQRRQFRLPLLGQRGIGRNIPCLAGKERPFNLARRAIVTGRTLFNSVLLRKSGD